MKWLYSLSGLCVVLLARSFIVEHWNWVIGLGFSLTVGHIVTAASLVFLRRYIERREEEWEQFSPKQKRRALLGLDFYPPVEEKYHLPKADKKAPERHVKPLIPGLLERLFFTVIIAFEVSGAAVGMVTWIALKMLASRKYREERAGEEGFPSGLPFEYAGLVGNLLSMLFALVGGLCIRNLWWW
jgi:hypothetical protein